MKAKVHKSHPEIASRLKRAEGHLHTTIAMIEAGRSCLDLAQQLHAVERAIANAKRTLIEDHIDHCLETAAKKPNGARDRVHEFKRIARYL